VRRSSGQNKRSLRGADGTEACSFIAIRRPPDPPLVLFLDCHGEVISTLASGADDPIVKTVMNCRPAFGGFIMRRPPVFDEVLERSLEDLARSVLV